MIVKTDKIIERLLLLAHGDIDLVSEAIFLSAHGKSSANLSDVISHIQEENRKAGLIKPR